MIPNEDFDVKVFLDNSHPLMEAFKEHAPSSYKHCQNVAGFCDAISIELKNVNKEYLRCAALYHDIGKMINPSYFIENLLGAENPHETINDPKISALIISKHVSDSVAILAKNDFPNEIIKIIIEHHGDTRIQYFYNKASKEEKDNPIFRYNWDRPQTTESAILMIADVVESAARCYNEKNEINTKEQRAQLVYKLIRTLSNDDQLDNIKHGVIKACEKILPIELDALYHKRLDYDEDNNKEKTINEKVSNNS